MTQYHDQLLVNGNSARTTSNKNNYITNTKFCSSIPPPPSPAAGRFFSSATKSRTHRNRYTEPSLRNIHLGTSHSDHQLPRTPGGKRSKYNNMVLWKWYSHILDSSLPCYKRTRPHNQVVDLSLKADTYVSMERTCTWTHPPLSSS